MLGPRAEINLNNPLAYPPNESPLKASPQSEPQLAPILAETQIVNQPDPNSVLEHFTSSSTSAPLFSSPPSFNLSPMFNESFNNHFFNFSPPQNPFFTQNISIHSPTLNLPNISNFNVGPSHTTPRPPPQLPRSKVERTTSKTRSDVKKLFQAVQLLDSHLTYNTLENSIMRDWISNILCERFNLPKPPLNPYPIPVHVMPQTSTSSSSDGSSPSRHGSSSSDVTKGEKKNKKEQAADADTTKRAHLFSSLSIVLFYLFCIVMLKTMFCDAFVF
ncbi:hypothetical protein L195_g045708 [Trifolium pratense]|uniref:Uncharacterized protein n=1 Tax=Trifolium pratense TaxID=57577 RepID=A0A2K3MFM1_TRIPR|nr:hypothetical protein L195_g045708 [Trifolium pratense]